jgi:hypothetical protein
MCGSCDKPVDLRPVAQRLDELLKEAMELLGAATKIRNEGAWHTNGQEAMWAVWNQWDKRVIALEEKVSG